MEKIGSLSEDIREIKSRMTRKREEQKMSSTPSSFSFNPFNILGNRRQEEVEFESMEREEMELKVKKD